VFRRIAEIILGLIIGLSGIGFLWLAIFILRTPTQSQSSSITALVIVFSLSFLCLTVAFWALKRKKETSGGGQCSQCGTTTEIPDLFIHERRSFRSSYRSYCPFCWNKRKTSTYKWNILGSCFLGAFSLVFLKLFPDSAIAYFFLNLVIFQFLEIPSTFLHELAHAWTGKKLGMRVYKICIGFGKLFFTGSLFGFNFEYRAFPIMGRVFAAYPEKEISNGRQILFVAAGPLMNLILVVSAVIFIPQNEWNVKIFVNSIVPLQLLFWLNVFILITNLWPRTVTTPFGVIQTDGKQLLENIRRKEEVFDQRYIDYFLLEGKAHFEKKQYKEARSAYENGLEHYKENFSLLTWLGLVLIQLNDFSGARKCFHDAMPFASTPVNEALTKNNIAYADALMEDSTLLEEADRYSQEAIQTLSWIPSVRGTRGVVLLQSGRLDEAIELLTDSVRLTEDLDGKAENLCFLAIAERVRGNVKKSDQYLMEARRLDPTCFLLQRAERGLVT
jgi:tetratricopeptide (TPR) repeat protein